LDWFSNVQILVRIPQWVICKQP